MAGWRSEWAGCRSTLSMSKIKVRISETKYRSFYKTLQLANSAQMKACPYPSVHVSTYAIFPNYCQCDDKTLKHCYYEKISKIYVDSCEVTDIFIWWIRYSVNFMMRKCRGNSIKLFIIGLMWTIMSTLSVKIKYVR